MAYAERTDVSTDRSIAEIRATLRRYHAAEMMHVEGERTAAVLFTMKDRRVMFRLAMPDPKDRAFTHTPGKGQARSAQQAYAAWEQACRARWRSLALVIKAKLEAVEAGITEFETEFLGNIVVPGTEGMVMADIAREKLALAYRDGAMPPLLPDYTKGERP